MAAPHEREQPWSLSEKNYMLAEIIKANYPHPNVLLGVINQMGLQHPNWNEIALPPGRTLNACVLALDDIRRTQGPPMMHGPYRPQTPSPMSAHVPVNLKRPFPYDSSFHTGREIRPKPSIPSSAYGQMSTMENPPRKKRGRPKKAESLPQGEVQIATGASTPGLETMSPPPARLADPQVIETGTPFFQPALDPTRPLGPPARSFPISSILTPTGPPSGMPTSSSSGKRKRGRSTRSEPEQSSAADAPEAREVEEYESPYMRAGADSQDTRAEAVVLRRSDDPESSFRQDFHESGAQLPAASR